MAKKKQLTKEEILEKSKEREIQEWEKKIHRIPEPEYTFSKGDIVSFRPGRSDHIDDVLFGGKAYGFVIEFSIGSNREEHYRIEPWPKVKPVPQGDSCFAKKTELNPSFIYQDLRTVIDDYYSNGINMDPEYQRGYVWDACDKELLINSIFNGIDIGRLVLARTPDSVYFDTYFSHEIVDGKQRLGAIIEYYENRFPYKGKFFNDLGKSDQRFFLNTSVQIADIKKYDKRAIIEYFIKLNQTGKHMDPEHIKKIEDMASDAREEEK